MSITKITISGVTSKLPQLHKFTTRGLPQPRQTPNVAPSTEEKPQKPIPVKHPTTVPLWLVGVGSTVIALVVGIIVAKH